MWYETPKIVRLTQHFCEAQTFAHLSQGDPLIARSAHLLRLAPFVVGSKPFWWGEAR
jgi:hypothetical protein